VNQGAKFSKGWLIHDIKALKGTVPLSVLIIFMNILQHLEASIVSGEKKLYTRLTCNPFVKNYQYFYNRNSIKRFVLIMRRLDNHKSIKKAVGQEQERSQFL
jgi:hypothetical protein